MKFICIIKQNNIELSKNKIAVFEPVPTNSTHFTVILYHISNIFFLSEINI